MLLPQVSYDCGKVQIFFLHFLMMTSALFSLTCSYEKFHSFEDFVHAPHVPIDEMRIMNLQKPMIFFIFLG